MPNRLKKTTRAKRQSDPNEWAHEMVRISTGDAEEKTEPTDDFRSQLSDYMSKLGQKGGWVSGKRRMENLTPEQRSDIALKAARARWAKAKAKQQKS